MRIEIAAIALVTAIIATSCSTVPPPAKWPDRFPCVDDRMSGLILATLEKSTDSLNTPGAQTVLVKNFCEKRIYVRGKYRLVIFRDPGRNAFPGMAPNYIQLQGFANPNRGELTEAAGAQCLAQAGDDLRRFGIEPNMLATYREKNPVLWSDPDAGPAHYLNCSGGRDTAYYFSLTVMVHELTHQLTSQNGKCLYLGYPPGQMCFEIPSTLPSGSIAILKGFPTANRKIVEGLTKMQDLYLIHIAQITKGPLFLFNELNAYTAGNEATTAIARHEGMDKLYHDGHRNSEMLPLLSLWVAKYLAEMKERDPDFYSETLSPETDDGRRVRALLARAEESYAAWIAELKKTGKAEETAEHDLWQQYLAERKLIAG